jgi:hypothetical protein
MAQFFEFFKNLEKMPSGWAEKVQEKNTRILFANKTETSQMSTNDDWFDKNRLHELTALCIADRERFVAEDNGRLSELMVLAVTGDAIDRYNALCLLSVYAECDSALLHKDIFALRIVEALAFHGVCMRSQMVLRLLGILTALVDDARHTALTEEGLFSCISAALSFGDRNIRKQCVALLTAYYSHARIQLSARISMFIVGMFDEDGKYVDAGAIHLVALLVQKSRMFREALSASPSVCRRIFDVLMRHQENADTWRTLALLRSIECYRQYLICPLLTFLAERKLVHFESCFIMIVRSVFSSSNYQMNSAELRCLLRLPDVPRRAMQLVCLDLMLSQRSSIALPLYMRHFGYIAHAVLRAGIESHTLAIEEVAQRFRRKPSLGFVDRSFFVHLGVRGCDLWQRLEWCLFRSRVAAVCVAMQNLHLPALQTLLIVDEMLPNSYTDYDKWALITAVKHFQR